MARTEAQGLVRWLEQLEGNVTNLQLDVNDLKSGFFNFRKDFDEHKNYMMTQLDRLVANFEKLDQERILTHASLERLEMRVDRLDRLGQDTAAGLVQLGSRFEQFEANTTARFEKLESRFEQFEANTIARFEQLETGTTARFDRLEKDTGFLKEGMVKVLALLMKNG